MAITLAPTSTPTAIATVSRIGTTVTGTAPRLLANVFHTPRPTINPSGTPTTTPTRANVVACHETVETTWRLTNPRTFKSPTSRRRRDTLTTSRCASVAAPNTASMAPKMSGKSTASPKLTREVGAWGCDVIEGYAAR